MSLRDLRDLFVFEQSMERSEQERQMNHFVAVGARAAGSVSVVDNTFLSLSHTRVAFSCSSSATSWNDFSLSTEDYHSSIDRVEGISYCEGHE